MIEKVAVHTGADSDLVSSEPVTFEDLPEKLNLTSYFLDRNLEEGRGERPALYCGDSVYSYAEVASLTDRIGSVMLGLEVQPGDKVLLALSDGPEFVAAWYAVLKIGGVVAEAYTFLPPDDYAYLLNYMKAAVVVVDDSTLDKIRQRRDDCPHLRHVLVVGAAGELAPGEVDLDAEIEVAGEGLQAVLVGKDDVALWKFTTGSTGAPKAAVHAAHDPIVSFEAYAKGVIGYRTDDVVLPIPKLFFGYARDAATLFTFGMGAAGAIFPGRSTPERIFDLIEKHRPTMLVQVPTMVNSMLAHPGAADRDLSSVRLCISSGEALPRDLHMRWQETFGVEIIEGIGSSELYHIYISNRPGEARPGSAGRLVPGYRATLTDTDGKPVAPGEPGELWVSGESAASKYQDDVGRSNRTFFSGWVRTGDIFRRDTDGFYWYEGRVDDHFKAGGIWVSPLEIELCLLNHESVSECVVTRYEEAQLSLPKAFIVTTEGVSGNVELAEELKDFVRARLSPHKYPREVTFLDQLPRTASGKVDRRSLSDTAPETTVRRSGFGFRRKKDASNKEDHK